jgi:uncharacterized small protein (DUF1192 family)
MAYAVKQGWGERDRRKAAMPLFDEEPVRVVKPRLLDDLSIQELKEKIESLKGEIAACEAMIVKKEATRKAAEAAFFKS